LQHHRHRKNHFLTSRSAGLRTARQRDSPGNP
jgi:hypothetical protein